MHIGYFYRLALTTIDDRIKTTAIVEHEVQTIRTGGGQGQTLEGGFKLHYNGYTSSLIRHDTTAAELKAIMEDNMNAAKINILQNIDRSHTTPGIGEVAVSRFPFGSSGGYEWRITFMTAVGNIGEVDSGPMTITNLLRGIGASAVIDTVKDGNTIGGTFSLEFLGTDTRYLSHDTSATDMESVLMHDVPGIINAKVTRSGTHQECNDGFCKNGPDQAGGYTWELSITTTVDNLSPFSPTSPDYDRVGTISELGVKNNLTGCVNGICPNISISTYPQTPFSLSYGGGGGSFGGEGGEGFSYIPRAQVYGDKLMSNLHGGSGGALGFAIPYDVHMVGLPTKVRGGSGGGAIEIIALNDITMGANSIISCNGESGWSSFMTAGGGGSGGSILLSAGGTIQNDARLSVRGGDGGIPAQEESKFKGGAGGGGGRIATYGESIAIEAKSSIDLSGGICFNNDTSTRDCNGMSGSFYEEQLHVQEYSIDKTIGAMQTNSSLRLHAFSSNDLDSTNSLLDHHLAGPTFVFQDAASPVRVSFFVKAFCRDRLPTQGWEASLILRPGHGSEDTVTTLGFSFGSDMKHGLISSGGLRGVDNRQRMEIFHSRTKFDQWYKMDVLFDWHQMTYSVHLDDYAVVQGAIYNLNSIGSISLSTRPSNVDVWFDEIFVGNDATLGFRCPTMKKGAPVEMPEVGNRGWNISDLGGVSNHHAMTRHASHLSQRELYSRSDKGGVIPLDGQGHRKFTSGVKYRPSSNNIGKRFIRPGDILKTEDGRESLHIWYGEHQVESDEQLEVAGGVGACSTIDMKTWKNEGIVIHDMNVTDMVRGSTGPFHIERPKVLYNTNTSKYVMWMIVDNANRSLAMAGVATSDHANGPFTFVRSFYPDGNRTRDQTIFQEDGGSAYLIRTFYDTVEYVLPSPIMQPIWESVKNADGSTNFPLTYHRAQYEEGYDNYHDIYLQRWRGEDKPWQVLCIDRITHTEREIPYGAKGDELCSGPFEFKKVIGQGDPTHEGTKDGIRSRFLDPNDPLNNVWKPNSVPGVKAQSWHANYEAGSCGQRLVDDDIQPYDPNLSTHTNVQDRSECSNIVDNPTHPTLPDQLLGRPQVVERRRAKFIAVSRLTFDYLDTTGSLSKFEGELEDGADLSFLVNRAKESSTLEFGWKSGGKIDSTFSPPVHYESFHPSTDWDTNFHQHDNSFYSLQCIIDGKCPVNFRDQVQAVAESVQTP